MYDVNIYILIGYYSQARGSIPDTGMRVFCNVQTGPGDLHSLLFSGYRGRYLWDKLAGV